MFLLLEPFTPHLKKSGGLYFLVELSHLPKMWLDKQILSIQLRDSK